MGDGDAMRCEESHDVLIAGVAAHGPALLEENTADNGEWRPTGANEALVAPGLNLAPFARSNP
jgi:hypothetical protein